MYEEKNDKKEFKKSKKMPKLEDLYNVLGKDKRTEKFRIKLIPFVKGSMKFFNNYTNIEINNELKEIKQMLLEKQKNKVNNKKIIYISLGVLLLILMIILFIVFHDDSFTFKTVSSNCSNFEISGSIAYNKNKSYLYISNIDYCGGTDNNLYKKIECLLYEEHGMVKKQIGNYTYEKDSSIKLNDFLKDVNFSIDNFAKECKNIEKSNITLEITATDEEDKTTIYKVPLSMNKSCN